MRGIDISEHQQGLSIQQVKDAGYEFVILRGGYTGYGANRSKNKDKLFETFYAQAKALGMPVGCYYYSCANTRQGGIEEAQFLYENCLKGKQFEYPIYIDVEEERWQASDKAGVTDAIIGFCDTLKNYFVGVYASQDWFKNKIDTPRLDFYSKWVASWRDARPSFDYAGFQMWQNSDNGNIAGFRIDTDEAFIDFPSIIISAGLNGYSSGSNNLKSIDQVAQEVIAGVWGNGDDRVNRLQQAGYDYNAVQSKVNEMLSPRQKSLDEIAQEVINGQWGNGDNRRIKLASAGYDYNQVQAKVNQLMGANRKSLDQIAREVIRGDWGNGDARRKALTNAGYNYDEVQARVNQMM